jgi:uncharacterized membrane protein
MRDRGNQVVLGTFIATFVYCMLVLRTVRGENGTGDAGGGAFVPHIAVTLAIVLALASLGVLIFFIHHAAVSMQAPTVIANVAAELCTGIDEMFPEEMGDEAPAPSPPPDDEHAIPGGIEAWSNSVSTARAARSGYVQLIDDDRLMQIASENDLLLRVVHRPGRFVVEGDALALVSRVDHLSSEPLDEIRETFLIGSHQTPTQDVELAVNQLVEVAVRALSPGINDPFTAMTCVDHLGAALSRLATRRIPSSYRRDKHGRVRVIACPLAFPDVTETAFRQIRQYGRTSTAVLVRLLEAIANILPRVRRPEDREALLRQACLINEAAGALPQASDRDDVKARHAKLVEQHGRPTGC